MLDRVTWLGSLLLVGACARVPADVSRPESEPPAKAPVAATTDPIAEDCKTSELSTCADACNDAACLEWCAGRSCAATLASLWSCMDEEERRFAAERPSPTLDFEAVTDEHGQIYERPTDESFERQYLWEAAYDHAITERWTGTCQATCVDRLAPGTDEDANFCDEWRSSYPSWARLSRPPPTAETSAFGLLGTNSGLFGSLLLGTSVSLAGELAERSNDPHAAALAWMVRRVSGELDRAPSCVPDLPEDGRELVIAVELDQHGAVLATHLADQTPEGECVAEMLAAALALPVRVARDYPQLELRVRVQPTPDLGFGLEGNVPWGEIGGDYGGGLGGLGRGAGGDGGGGGSADLGED